MSADEIKLLQQRLHDAGCYQGTTDGTLSGALATAKAACPDQEPKLRIETGMHVAPVSSVDADSQCRLAATASGDKTVRLWSLPDGKLLRVMRPQIDAGLGGSLNAVAISPDGRFVAAGGWDAHVDFDHTVAITIFDTASGALVARAGAFENIVTHLTFSRDGRWLAATLGDNAGLRVIDTTTWRQVAADKATGGNSFGAAFAPDGRLYALANGNVRRYGMGPAFRLEAVVKTRGGHAPQSVAIDPAGERIAVSFGDTTAIDLYAAPGLNYYAASGIRDVGNGADLSEISWRGDGKALIAGGSYSRDGKLPFLFFGPDGRRLDDSPESLASNSIRSIARCGDGFVVATGDPAFGLLDGAGRAAFWLRGASVDMREKLGAAFVVADNATRVRFGLEKGSQRPVLFDLRRAALDDSPAPAPGLSQAIATGAPPELSRTSVKLAPHEVVTSVAIDPDRRSYVLATVYSIMKVTARGLVWRVAAPDIAWGVNISPDDRLVVAAYGDGTIRWHRVDDGRELLALFVNRETKAWVAWTPSGYYMASPGGEDLIGWHVNRGWDQSADFFPASRFRDRFNRPDVVELVLDTLDEDAAVRQADAKAHRREETKPLVAELPPLIRISDPPDGGRVAAAQTKLDYVWRSPSGLPVEAIEVQIDGRRVKEETLPVRPADANAEVKGSLEIALPPHDVEVGLIAYSGDIKSEVAAVKLTWTGPVPPTAPPRHLHALIAGVSDYAAPEMALAYAAKDARDFAHALESQKGGYYADVETRVIVDREVTRASLIDGLDWLSKQAGPDDVSVLFLAGHGVTDENLTYWYLPSDATEEQAHGKGLSQDDVQRALRSVSGRVIWFLDTCHAGGAATRSTVDVNRLVNTVTSAESGGIVAFASSKGNETSFESSVWKNGAFTKALVEGIENGKAAFFGQEAIKIKLLEEYLEFRVGELTEHEQTPTMQLPPQVADFIIAVAKKKP